MIGWELTNDDTEFLTINLTTLLTSGQEYHIDISFQGDLQTDGFGYFKSSYLLENFETEYKSNLISYNTDLIFL